MNRSEVGLLLEVVMHLGYWVHDRTARARVALIALLLLALCMAIFVLLAERSQEPLGIDELYGHLD
jgi:nitrate/nitrite transporter NarK